MCAGGLRDIKGRKPTYWESLERNFPLGKTKRESSKMFYGSESARDGGQWTNNPYHLLISQSEYRAEEKRLRLSHN